MKTMLRMIATMLALSVLLSAAGCGASPTPGPTATPPDRPDVTANPAKIAAPIPGGYDGFSLKVKPAQGQEVIIKDSACVQLVMDAFSTARLQVKDAQGKFNDTLTVQDAVGKAKYVFALTSDGQLLLKTQNGRVFRMPEYVYYLIENSLWTYGASLDEDMIQWQPDKGTTTLELELPRLIKAAMLPAFGYSLAYFTTYSIYGVNTDTRNTAKVYLLVTYAGYGLDRQSFTPKFLYASPMTMIFTTTGNNKWKIAALKQPPATTDKTQLYNNIRTIFPFDYMSNVVDDMNAKTTALADMKKDIVRQATEYLNTMGMDGLTVES